MTSSPVQDRRENKSVARTCSRFLCCYDARTLGGTTHRPAQAADVLDLKLWHHNAGCKIDHRHP